MFRPSGVPVLSTVKSRKTGGDFSCKGIEMKKSFQLRSTPDRFNIQAVMMMLQRWAFFDKYKNKHGRGLRHDYKSIERNGAKLVIDRATGLMWQQGGSEERITFADAQKYIAQLNREKFAGYNDWRLPTLEEAISLMEPKENSADLYIDPVFDKSQRWIWTTDKEASGGAWYVSFYSGHCARDYEHYYSSVRAVRSG